ncbi:MAG: T9SS type A sorting domain-containing protein [Calditrichaeota bacterium]|nr:T9SS type A sorting domain-containing protein [Calditrichota bacterium]
MKIRFQPLPAGVALMLAGLCSFALAEVPAMLSAPEITIDPVGQVISPDFIDRDEPGGPRRDPLGDTWIFYDDGSPQSLWPVSNLWTRVDFTPNARFRLQGVRVMPLNQFGDDNPCNVYVYRLDQQNFGLGERVYTGRINQLPVFNFNDIASNWQTLVFNENQYVTFNEGERFAIMYGVAPGGNYQGAQQGDGWWDLMDGAGVNRSYRAQVANLQAAPPTPLNSWTLNSGGDFLIRANGNYLAAFMDAGVIDVFSGEPGRLQTGKYATYQGTEQIFKAEIVNYGSDVDAYLVRFQVLDADGRTVFDSTNVEQDLSGGDTVIVTCAGAWESGAPGRYTVAVEVQVPNDSNVDNNFEYLDQIVIDPVRNADDWISYTDGELEGATNWSEGSGWAAVYYHPGDERTLKITHCRVGVSPSAAQEYSIPMRIYILDTERLRYTQVWSYEARTNGAREVQYVEFEIPADSATSFQRGQAAIVAYLYRNGCAIQMDNTPPIAGTNVHMPWAMLVTGDDGANYGPNRSGDYGIDVRIAEGQAVGPFLRIEPDTLDIGYDLALGEDHSVECLFISYGTDSVTIRNINVSPSARNFFTVEPTSFELAGQDTETVRVTFRTEVDTTISTTFLVANTSQNAPQRQWRVRASTRPNRVSENVRPGIPEAWSLTQNFPNPFNPTTTIEFALKNSGLTAIGIYDQTGRRVQEVHRGVLPAGYHSLEIDASGLPAGVYIYRLTAPGYSASRKMVLMK